MKKISFLLSLIILLYTQCDNASKTPKVSYDTNNKNKVAVVKIDSTKIQIADLPIQIKETKYLLHPIGDYTYNKASKFSYGSSGNSELNFSISNSNEYEITGYIQNLKFQHTDSLKIRSLTNKPILIETITYLNSIAEKTNQQLLIYSMADSDTNGDQKVDSDDIKSLYISTVGGLKFKKLTSDFQELIDWNVIESNNKLYFRTIEDTNKNGQFDSEDKLHYQFVDLSTKEKIAQEYKPI